MGGAICLLNTGQASHILLLLLQVWPRRVVVDCSDRHHLVFKSSFPEPCIPESCFFKSTCLASGFPLTSPSLARDEDKSTSCAIRESHVSVWLLIQLKFRMCFQYKKCQQKVWGYPQHAGRDTQHVYELTAACLGAPAACL